MEGKIEGEFVCFDVWFVSKSTDVIMAELFGVWVQKMKGQHPQS